MHPAWKNLFPFLLNIESFVFFDDSKSGFSSGVPVVQGKGKHAQRFASCSYFCTCDVKHSPCQGCGPCGLRQSRVFGSGFIAKGVCANKLLPHGSVCLIVVEGCNTVGSFEIGST